MIKIAVIIANWNGQKYLKDCLESLCKQSYRSFKIVFVDNGSVDGSVDFVREDYPEAEIIILEKNTGFAKGYNIGIKKALEDEDIEYVIIVNNDTRLHEKFIENMINCSQRYPDVGSIQPKVLNFFNRDKIDCAGILFSIDGVAVNRGYGEKDRGQFEDEVKIFGANGTASLFSRIALEKTQLRAGEYFDNDYFAYYEDLDLIWRMRLAGYESYYCPSAKLFHMHSATADRISGFKAYYLNRNRFFTLIKNYPIFRLAIAIFIFTPIRYIFLFFRVIIKKRRKGTEFSGQNKLTVAKAILRAWGSVVANIPDLVKKRRVIQKNKKVSSREIGHWFRKYGVKWSKTF
jgi:GT2 family glycosyltransferase